MPLSGSSTLLCIHPNFPGQFGRLIDKLQTDDGWRVIGMGCEPPERLPVKPTRYYQYGVPTLQSDMLYPPVASVEESVRRGRSAARIFQKLTEAGLSPDIILVHPGWGDALFIRDFFPNAKIIAYLEYYYRNRDSDVDFDPEFPAADLDLQFVRLKNLPSLQAACDADVCVTPTHWQRDIFPEPLRSRIQVIHDGIDAGLAGTGSETLTLPDGSTVSRSDDVVTFVARSLEPYRGFHTFMRAIPAIQARSPGCTIVIVGRDQVSYGREPSDASSWRQRLTDELTSEVNWDRVFFLGAVPHAKFVDVLRVSAVHVYLTYPFVLSWSFLEAMSAGCAIVAADVAPVAEFAGRDRGAVLVDGLDPPAVAKAVCDLLQDPKKRVEISTQAMEIATGIDFRKTIYPKYRGLFSGLLC